MAFGAEMFGWKIIIFCLPGIINAKNYTIHTLDNSVGLVFC